MPEYVNVPIQTVAADQNVLFSDTRIPCNSGYVVHREGAGIVTLRGIVNNNSHYAVYKVSFGGNIAVPIGQTVGDISIAIAINGESDPSTEAIAPAFAAERFENVYTSTFIKVPKGCCYTISVKNTSDIPIEVENANLMIERTA